MKKTLSIILALVLSICLFAGCNTPAENNIAENNAENNIVEENDVEEINTKVINPLPETLDINALDNCTVAVSLEKGNAYVDDEGKMMMDVKVYAYELYDMVDIASLAENDVIVRRNEEVTVESVERLETGLININGGEENGGFSLISNDSTVYYEIGMSDAKAYYELGEVTLPVSEEFIYTDASNLDAEAAEYYAGDFLVEDAGLEYNFYPGNTSIVIEDGYVVAMEKVYTP